MTNDEAHDYLLSLVNRLPPDERDAGKFGAAIRAIRAAAIADVKNDTVDLTDRERQALKLGLELLEQGYVDKHIVTFTENGYALEHPIHCRRDMTGCVYQEWLATELAPARDPGRYIMRWINNQARYTPLEI